MTWIGNVASVAAMVISAGSITYSIISGRRVDRLNAKTQHTVAETMETLRETAAIQAESRRTISRLRAVGTCSHPCPIDITTLADPAPTALCTGCGQRMSMDEAGRWVITMSDPITEGDQTPGG